MDHTRRRWRGHCERTAPSRVGAPPVIATRRWSRARYRTAGAAAALGGLRAFSRCVERQDLVHRGTGLALLARALGGLADIRRVAGDVLERAVENAFHDLASLLRAKILALRGGTVMTSCSGRTTDVTG